MKTNPRAAGMWERASVCFQAPHLLLVYQVFLLVVGILPGKTNIYTLFIYTNLKNDFPLKIKSDSTILDKRDQQYV